MIVDNGKYYLYRHIRCDKDKPFYIGIGVKGKRKTGYNSWKGEYARAFECTRRNPIWKNIVSKCSYTVEILMNSNDYEFIRSKEREFISMYGRVDNRTGTLANLTDGGEGVLGRIVSEESKEKCRLSNIGKKMPESAKKTISENQKTPIIMINPVRGTHKEYPSIEDASNDLRIGRWCISSVLLERSKQTRGLIFKYKK